MAGAARWAVPGVFPRWPSTAGALSSYSKAQVGFVVFRWVSEGRREMRSQHRQEGNETLPPALPRIDCLILGMDS